MVTVGFHRSGPVSVASGLTPPSRRLLRAFGSSWEITAQEEEERKGTEWPSATDPAWEGRGCCDSGACLLCTLVHAQPPRLVCLRKRLRNYGVTGNEQTWGFTNLPPFRHIDCGGETMRIWCFCSQTIEVSWRPQLLSYKTGGFKDIRQADVPAGSWSQGLVSPAYLWPRMCRQFLELSKE